MSVVYGNAATLFCCEGPEMFDGPPPSIRMMVSATEFSSLCEFIL